MVRGEIFSSMASQVYDAPRTVPMTLPDGTQKMMNIMETILDEETGELKVINDITGSQFDVYADIGPNYSTKKEETFDKLDKMIEKAAMIDPNMANLLFLKQVELVDGVNMENVRDYAHKQSLLKGFIEPDPDNEEEMQLVQQAQQNQQPDAKAKADANMADVQRKAKLDEFNAMTDAKKLQVLGFDAQTKRMAVRGLI